MWIGPTGRRWKNVVLDDESMWPPSGKVALDHAHADERGAIQSIVNFPMKNVSLIHSKKGAVRSNHYHGTDWHYMYVLRGSFDLTRDTTSPMLMRVRLADDASRWRRIPLDSPPTT